MGEMDHSEIGEEIERQWARVNKFLAQKTEGANIAAILEAQKVFVQVLEVASYGPTIDDKIRNAGGLFADEGSVLAAQAQYDRVISEVGYLPSSKEAKQVCDALMKGILNLIGRDFEPRSLTARMVNGLNYFWGHHPKCPTP